MQEQHSPWLLPPIYKEPKTRKMQPFQVYREMISIVELALMQIFLGQNVSWFMEWFSLMYMQVYTTAEQWLNIPLCAVSCRRTSLRIESCWTGIWTGRYWYPSMLPGGRAKQSQDKTPPPSRCSETNWHHYLHSPTYENDPFWEFVDCPAREIHHPASLL